MALRITQQLLIIASHYQSDSHVRITQQLLVVATLFDPQPSDIQANPRFLWKRPYYHAAYIPIQELNDPFAFPRQRTGTFNVTMQLMASFVPVPPPFFGTFNSTMQMVASFIPSPLYDTGPCQWGNMDWGDVTCPWLGAGIYPKILFQMQLVASFIPSVSYSGVFSSIMQLLASFAPSGSYNGDFSSTMQMTALFKPAGNFLREFNSTMQMQASFVPGPGARATPFTCMLQLTAKFISPQGGAGIVGVVNPGGGIGPGASNVSYAN